MLVDEIIHNKNDEHETYMLSSRIDQNGHNYKNFHHKTILSAANTDPLDPNTSKIPE